MLQVHVSWCSTTGCPLALQATDCLVDFIYLELLNYLFMKLYMKRDRSLCIAWHLINMIKLFSVSLKLFCKVSTLHSTKKWISLWTSNNQFADPHSLLNHLCMSNQISLLIHIHYSIICVCRTKICCYMYMSLFWMEIKEHLQKKIEILFKYSRSRMDLRQFGISYTIYLNIYSTCTCMF